MCVLCSLVAIWDLNSLQHKYFGFILHWAKQVVAATSQLINTWFPQYTLHDTESKYKICMKVLKVMQVQNLIGAARHHEELSIRSESEEFPRLRQQLLRIDGVQVMIFLVDHYNQCKGYWPGKWDPSSHIHTPNLATHTPTARGQILRTFLALARSIRPHTINVARAT